MDAQASVANTPKQILLLHEIDTYIGLLDIGIDTGNENETKLREDEGGVGDKGELHTSMESDAALLSYTMLPLILRLCSSFVKARIRIFQKQEIQTSGANISFYNYGSTDSGIVPH